MKVGIHADNTVHLACPTDAFCWTGLCFQLRNHMICDVHEAFRILCMNPRR